jgi:hypothetical protein
MRDPSLSGSSITEEGMTVLNIQVPLLVIVGSHPKSPCAGAPRFLWKPDTIAAFNHFFSPNRSL